MGEAEPSYPTVTADWQTRHGRRQRLHWLGNMRSIVPPGQSNASASAISMRTSTYRNECEGRWTSIWRPRASYTCRPRTSLRRGVESFPWRGVRLLCGGSGTLWGSGAPAACAWVPVSPGTGGVPGPSPAVDRVRSIVGRTWLRTAGVRLFGCSQGWLLRLLPRHSKRGYPSPGYRHPRLCKGDKACIMNGTYAMMHKRNTRDDHDPYWTCDRRTSARNKKQTYTTRKNHKLNRACRWHYKELMEIKFVAKAFSYNYS